jgi:hypothetical protein
LKHKNPSLAAEYYSQYVNLLSLETEQFQFSNC